MRLLRSTMTFSALTLLSRIAGYARDLAQSAVFGASAATDAFVIAYRIPNFLRRIFAEGSFQTAFVPVFTEYRQRGDAKALKDLLDHVAGMLFAAVLAVTALGVLAAPLIAAVFAPGTLDDPAQFALLTDMLRLTFPYLFFISLTALAASVLNSFGRFAIPALTPVLHNLAMIAAMFALAPLLDIPVMALAWGVLLAGLVQMLVQWAALARLGVVPRLRFARNHPGVRRVFRLMLPTIFGASVAQVNLLIGTVFASVLASGSQTWLYLTDRLMEFPQGLVGAALATVILPALSRCYADADHERYSHTLDWGLRTVLLVALPATVGLVVLAEPLNATLYQYGQFTSVDTQMAALSLMALALGLPGFMLAKVLAPAFFARQDTRTPVRAAVIAVLVNLLLCAAIVAPMWYFKIVGAHAGIALASAVAGCVNAWLLWRYLKRQGLVRWMPGWGPYLARIALGCVVMGALLLLASREVGDFAALPVTARFAHLLAVVGGGAAVYGLVLLATGWRPRALRGPG